MRLIDTCTDKLASAIRTGDIYKRYKKALSELKQMPEEKKKVDELRVLNCRTQLMEEDTNLYEVIDKVAEHADELRNIPQVQEFLEAEVELCRQLQRINATLIRGLDIDVPDL